MVRQSCPATVSAIKTAFTFQLSAHVRPPLEEHRVLPRLTVRKRANGLGGLVFVRGKKIGQFVWTECVKEPFATIAQSFLLDTVQGHKQHNVRTCRAQVIPLDS